MNKVKIQRFELAKQDYLRTFRSERLFFTLVNKNLGIDSPKETAKTVRMAVANSQNSFDEQLIRVFLENEESFDRYIAFRDSLQNYLVDVESCLDFYECDTFMVLGYKLGAYVERLKRLMEKILEFRGGEGSWALGLKYKNDYLKYIEELEDIAGLANNIPGVNHRISQKAEYFVYEAREREIYKVQ